MFQKTQRQLLLSNLAVLSLILALFTIVVRITFTRSLTQQLAERLQALGQGATASVEVENGQIRVEDDFPVQDLIARDQAFQWFDTQGRSIDQQGKVVLTLPFSAAQTVQIQAGQPRIQGVTLPVMDSDSGRLVGYVRVSQSLEDVDNTLKQLDWGLGGGVAIALVFSSIGGLWLTRQAMQPIERSFRQLQQFTADASHELRSPLMAIKSNAAVALKYPEGIRVTDAEKFEAIASATGQVTRLTEDLLLLARTDQAPQPDWNQVNLTALLENLVQLYQPQAIEKSIDLKAKISGSLMLIGDKVQLTRLFTNLIDNALHYTAANGTIEIKATQTETTAKIDVQDTGIGIAPEQLDHVFDRFWRADRSRSYWSGGSGLGLAIAQNIAQLHKGKITVSSQPGVGSCFTVHLRLTPL
ncbi:HAMP domain-containing histidine kinase [Microcoleus sp. FACHB-1515]|uniref:sensor histidine kinase n=1 Tax=Cyanophyceae TaxID=3028117 RepID=UPI00168853A6|nr:HAMP domain-containing sensor histidine kinase [Microcoleus sp. FACHB-1515]MBD2093374.1 HAMP domain-containing histidine kinase [Microcoleus sp. FACHB-1515]